MDRGPLIKAGDINKLAEFRPHLSDNGMLTFYCPACLSSSEQHKIRIPLHPTEIKGRSWQHEGSLEELTLIPDIDVGCWQGKIVRGFVHTC